ncbi:MAG: efflux RND transporter permease subunit [Dehalococcoidales bacterium]|nr:efflux RND transporter permease subunit [Dehalococcoidales bacterium]
MGLQKHAQPSLRTAFCWSITRTRFARGKLRFEAIVEAGPARLRPILMTTAAMVMAMLPTALQLGQGAESRSSMAVMIIGGPISSTLLALVLVPVVYTLFDDVQVWLRKKLFRTSIRHARRSARLDSSRHLSY